jgi:hypothetical protein
LSPKQTRDYLAHMRAIVVLAASFLAACQAGEQPPGERASASAPSPAAPAVVPPSTGAQILAAERLIGEYRVAGADGREIALPYGITASITPEHIHLTADCVNLEWSYRLEGGRLTTQRAPSESCARGLTAGEQAVVQAFDVATTVARTPSNGYEFAGGGHSVTLFTQ